MYSHMVCLCIFIYKSGQTGKEQDSLSGDAGDSGHNLLYRRLSEAGGHAYA